MNKSTLTKWVQEHLFLNAYWERLGRSSWVFLLAFTLQMVINVQFVSRSYALLPEGEELIVGLSQTETLVRGFIRIAFWSSLLWWGHALFSSRWGRQLAGGVIVFLSSSIFLLEAFTLGRYGAVYSHGVVLALAGTNPSEASEYIESSLSLSTLIRPVGMLCLLLLISWAWVRYSPRWWSKFSSIALSLLLVVPTLMTALYSLPRTYDKVMTSGHAYDLTIAPNDRVLWNTIGFLKNSKAIASSVERMKDIDLQLSVHQDPSTPAQEDLNVIVVIGETLRRDYMHCYGYPLSNTPRLDSILSTGDLIAYDSVVSPAPNTIESLTKILTYQTNDSGGNWYDYPALPTVFAQAGYWVEWISNQESSGTFIQPINTFAHLADEHHYVHARSIDEEHDQTKHFFDEGVFPYLISADKARAKGRSGLMQVVHLLGSHPLYKKRFPEAYARFTPQDLPIRRGEKPDQDIADYVNSVYYNDYVVSEIINRYSNRSTLLLYFSDHGEILYDDPRNPTYCDHGMTVEGVSVPLLIYMSPSMRNKYPELYEQLVSYKDRRIMLDLFTHTLPALLGIRTQYSTPELEFLSPGYRASRPRIIRSLNQELVL